MQNVLSIIRKLFNFAADEDVTDSNTPDSFFLQLVALSPKTAESGGR
jgi:hypothetical protein